MAVGEAALRLAGDMEWQQSHNPGSMGSHEPIADPLQALAQHVKSLAIGPTLQFGTVVDCVPYARCYRVLPENGKPIIDCHWGLRGSCTPIGVADGDTLQPGTHVFYIRHHTTGPGTIVCVVPNFMSDPKQSRSDQVNLASRCGIRVEPAHQAGFKLSGEKNHGGIEDRSNRTPTDSVEIGEFVRISETGSAITLDAYMAQFRMDAYTGLWLFYWDQLCRLAGHNFQRWTAGSVLESYDDESEHLWYHGVATYFWEALGQLEAPGTMLKERGGKVIQKDEPHYTREEPDPDNLQEFHRRRHYLGYLGQGDKLLIVSPPGGGGKQTYSDMLNLPGMAERNIGLDGFIFDRSAAGVVIAKRPVIPSPKRVKLPIDKEGDTKEDYKASGQFGEGSEHKVQIEPDVQGGQAGNVRALGVMDLHAYLFNWKGGHPFHYHEKDYHYPEESEVGWIDTNQEVPSFSQLSSQQYLDPPGTADVKIDHRYNTQKVFKNLSYINLLPDGGVVIGCGFGSEVRMVGGNIHLQAAGDITFEAGRNVVGWGGRDVIMRANKSCDISANQNDVRIKAEHNIQMLAANDEGPYGILLESLGTGPQFNQEQGHDANHSGIVLRAPKGQVVNWARDIYLRTGGGDVEEGIITLDAAKGSQDITMQARYFENYAAEGYLDFFGVEGNVTAANAWFPQGCGVNGPMCLTEGTISSGPSVIRGWFLASEGHIATEEAESAGFFVAPLEGEGLDSVNEAIDDCATFVTDTLLESGEQVWAGLYEDFWYAENNAGNDDIIENTNFAYRKQQDYRTESWELYEARWAQMSRLGGGNADTWKENPVKWMGQDTYPYPGKEKFEDASYYQLDTELFSHSTGRSADRGSAYESPKYKEPQSQTLNDTYPIVG